MTEVIFYEKQGSAALVGFKDFDAEGDPFLVYASVPFIVGEQHEELLQRAYEIAHSSIEYERNQNEHALTTEEEGELFEPAGPEVRRIEVEPVDPIIFTAGESERIIELRATVYDQYGEKYNTPIKWETENETLSRNRLKITETVEPRRIDVTASVGEISETITIRVFPHVKPQPSPESIEIADLKAVINTILGVKAE